MAALSPKTKRIRESHNLYLGVDGGGTKTHIVLIDEERKIICEGFSGASNPLRVGVETAVSNIIKALDATCDKAQINRGDVASAALGLAGVRREDIRQRVAERFSERLDIRKVKVVTDAEIALFGTTLGKAGVVIIAGTGSICYGKNEAGEAFSAGGWGPIAGDEGGGISIARRALQAIARSVDGRGKPTALSAAGTEYFRTSTPENVLIAIYSPQMDNAKIAGFARFVAETARAGDKIAIEILKEAGVELGVTASAVIKKLNLQRKKIPVGCVGSVFKSGWLLTDSLMRVVHQTAPKAHLSPPILQPAQAAARMAFEIKNKNNAS